MSTLSLRPDDRGGLRSTEKWSNSAIGWGNPHQQVLNVLEPASMSPSLFYTSHTLHSQSMFPQLMRSAEQNSALVQAFAQAKADSLNAHQSLEYTLLQSSYSNSMVESSTSDEDCTAPEIHMNCISALGGGPVSPVVANVLDRTASTGASLMAHEYFFRMHHPVQTSPGGGLLSPCRVSDESLYVATADLKRRFEEGDEECVDQMSVRKMQNGKLCEKAQAVLQDSHGFYAESPSPSILVLSLLTTYNSRDPALVMPLGRMPYLQKSNAGGGSASGVDMDSMRAILFRHASQPVPTLEEIASTRPKRRNVRISKDPQSVAARHRRERINDRMRVLQRLVPGGTKMDTASMLDEAIHYVKFLKLQLQSLEQIGNNYCDAQGNFAQPQAGTGDAQLGSLARRPFDLNCAAAFQAWPLNNNSSTNLQAPPQGRHSNQWACPI